MEPDRSGGVPVAAAMVVLPFGILSLEVPVHPVFEGSDEHDSGAVGGL